MVSQHSARLRHPRALQRPGWRVVRGRRTWIQRFLNPNELFGLKVTLLLVCYLLSAALHG